MSTNSSGTRYRCEACGNLTRFEVTATRTICALHHYTVGGELTIEEPEVVAESIDSVVCRWCGNGDSIVVIDDDYESTSADDAAPVSGVSGGVG